MRLKLFHPQECYSIFVELLTGALRIRLVILDSDGFLRSPCFAACATGVLSELAGIALGFEPDLQLVEFGCVAIAFEAAFAE